MRVFLDTNILLDVIENRPGLAASSEDVLLRCDELSADTFIAWHSLATAYYILKRGRTLADAMQMVDKILDWADIAPVASPEAHRARTLGFPDFEDALQAAAAESCRADLIVTRNTGDFARSSVLACTPEEFLQKHGAPTQPAS